jgi:hypothetical protein
LEQPDATQDQGGHDALPEFRLRHKLALMLLTMAHTAIKPTTTTAASSLTVGLYSSLDEIWGSGQAAKSPSLSATGLSN